MKYSLEIRGGRAFFYQDKGTQKIHEESKESLALPDQFRGLPETVRGIQWWDSTVIAVVELPPRVRSISWMTGLDKMLVSEFGKVRLAFRQSSRNAQYQERNLAFPYIILVFAFHNGEPQEYCHYAFYRTVPLAGWNDVLFKTNLLNVWCDLPMDGAYKGHISHWEGRLSLPYVAEQGLSVPDTIEEAVRQFLWSGFNAETPVLCTDYYHAVHKQLDSRIFSVEAWEHASREDPDFMDSIAWPESGHTVSSVVDLAFTRVFLRNAYLAG
jgi:hypothetical protein